MNFEDPTIQRLIERKKAKEAMLEKKLLKKRFMKSNEPVEIQIVEPVKPIKFPDFEDKIKNFKNLSVIEKGILCDSLITYHGFNKKEISKLVGRSRQAVSDCMMYSRFFLSKLQIVDGNILDVNVLKGLTKCQLEDLRKSMEYEETNPYINDLKNEARILHREQSDG
jgi:hypothetical protein